MKLTPEQIQELLTKTIESAMKGEAPVVEKSANAEVMAAIANLTKAVSGINERVEQLDKQAVKTVTETTDDKIAGLAKSIEALAKKIEGTPEVPEADQPIEGMKKGDMLKMIEAAIAKAVPTPSVKGHGKEILKAAADGTLEIETADEVEGEVAKTSKLSDVEQLDEYFGKSLEGMMNKRGMGSAETEEDDE